MKRRFLCAFFALFAAALLSAQVMERPQVKNTAWTGFGVPHDRGIMFHGITDYFQARFDLGSKFTMEGMLNTGLLADYYNNDFEIQNYKFGTTNLNPLALLYGTRIDQTGDTNENPLYNNGINRANLLTDAFYVNFLYHAGKYFDIGMGTNLNWEVGPAPLSGGDVWEADAHVSQGGFSTAYDGVRSGHFLDTSDDSKGDYKFDADAPGTADVVGFVPYANSYAKRAVGARFINENLANSMSLEIGLALPNAFINNPAINVGAQFAPINWLSFAVAFEGLNFSNHGSNFYTGVTVGADFLVVDAYLALDNLFSDDDNDGAYATGATVTFTIPNTKITLAPEVGVNWFEHPHYTPAVFTGIAFNWDITSLIDFNVYTSLAWGSRDNTWTDNTREKWTGGFIWDIRPSLKFTVSEVTSFDVYLDLQTRTSFDNYNRWLFLTGVFFTQIIR